MFPQVTWTDQPGPARRFLIRAALVAFVALLAIPAAAANPRFFRPAQSTLPSPSFAPAAPPAPSATQTAPGEPTLADPVAPAAPLTDAPRFIVPGTPTLKTPTLPLAPAAPPAPVRTLPTPASPPQTITSLRPDGAACLLVDVTADYLNRLISTPRQDAGPVSDLILGARVEGQQTTQSSVWIRTLPCPQLARFDVNLGGETCSRTTAMTPQAAIDMAGRQKFDLHKSVEFDGARFITRTPATQLEVCQQNLRARTGASQIPVVNSIAETIALNQANMRKPLAHHEAARRTTDRVLPTFNQAIDDRLGAANDWLSNLSTTAPSVHSFLTGARWSSTDTSVNGQLLAAVAVESAAPLARGGASIRMHESFGPSLSTALALNGREIGVEEIRRWIGVFSTDVGGQSEDPSLPSLTPPVSATLRLADVNPLSFRFHNNEVRVVLRASIRAGDAVELPVHRISIGYSIRRLGDKFQLEPLPVVVEAEAAGTLADTVEQVIKSRIESRLEPLTVTADAIPPAASGARPRVSDITTDNGWLVVVFD